MKPIVNQDTLHKFSRPVSPFGQAIFNIPARFHHSGKKFSIIIILFAAFFMFFTALPVLSMAGTVELPKTGQATCYDEAGTTINCAGTGQDGDIQAGVAWPSPRFTPASTGTMTDNLTGLMWTQDANLPGYKSWQEALGYVAGMNTGTYENFGHTDWRLPNINELESLINAEEANSTEWLNSQGFTNVQSNIYWSSTTLVISTDKAWVIWMTSGGVGFDTKTYYFLRYVWPVRTGSGGSFGNSDIWKTGQTTSYATGDDGDIQAGTAWPSPRFTDNGDNTVTDNLTGLVWVQDVYLLNEYNTWQEALDYVAGMNAGTNPNLGYTDWRLPNRKEFFSLKDHSKYYPAIPTDNLFPYLYSSFYWSSTSVASVNENSYAWHFWSSFGYVYSSSKVKNISSIWPVRSDSGGPSGNCTYSISPTSQTFNYSAVTESVDVSAPGSCGWTAVTNDPDWTTVTSGSSGIGNGTVGYIIAPNNAASTRTGTMTIAGNVFTVTQTGTGTALTLDIKANNSDGPITIGTGEALSVAISLIANDHAGQAADWWILAVTPSGLQSFDLDQGFVPGLSVTYQGAVNNLGPATLNTPGLTAGAYTYYFAIDLDQDGELDTTPGVLYYDSVIVNVQ